MFKLDRKLIISASAVSLVALFAVGCVGTDAAPSSASSASSSDIAGGVIYPVVNGKTGPYSVNTNAIGMKINHGRIPTAGEIAAWDKDVMPDGTGLPEGSGTVEDGEEIYDAKCVSCHGDFGSGGGGYPALAKGNAYKLQKTLTNQRVKPDADGPVRVFGSYWPKVSTLWWYIKDGMPHPKSKTLTDDETYALTAYILNINEMEIDGEMVEDEYELDREKLLKVVMPNEKGFEPNIDGPNSLAGIKAYYANPSNFGAVKVAPADRCMVDCQEPTAKTVYIQNGGINDFNPPMATAKDLPKTESALDVKQVYADNCAMCHGSGVAPAAGDKEAWTYLIAKGMDKVYANGINGTDNGMPPKGGSSISDSDFKLVVDYIINGK
jgi:cytochrome c